MVNLQGHLEDNDLDIGQYQDDDQSLASISNVPTGGRRALVKKTFCLGVSSSDDKESEGEGSHYSPKQGERVEQGSPQWSLGHSSFPKDPH